MVVISQIPFLSVKDGAEDDDIDFQSTTNLIQGSWQYSDLCPIQEAFWSVENLAGKVLFDFQPIPDAAKKFYNDELALENGMKYVVTVKTVDFMGRTKIARSDGVTVRIQPPLPGLVRDGLDKDINYQFSTTKISANWDYFGDSSKDPTQSIHHYEIAVGNDRRYLKTRSNVHSFVNVGLNKTYTFTNLNLTAKLVKYYITVRSYSVAGSYTEGYSNGLRVGFNDDIIPGQIYVKPFQSSTNTIDFYWDGFKSDIDIIDFKIAVSSYNVMLTNDTLQCELLMSNESIFDVHPLESVGKDEYVKLNKLSLFHNHTYYATVIAEDEAGMCISVTSEQVLVDTSPSTSGKIFVNNIESDTVIYLRSSSELHVEWKNFSDPESGIKETAVQLHECDVCITDIAQDHQCYVFDESIVNGDSKTSFFELDLNTMKTYYIVLQVKNEANLITTSQSSPILLDTTEPLSGEVKITNEWIQLQTYQSSTTSLSGFLAIATTWDDYICPTQMTYFPSVKEIKARSLDGFSDDYLTVNLTGGYLGIGYNSDLSSITKSGFESEEINVLNGNFSFSIQAASGNGIVTTVAFVTDQIAIPFSIVGEKPRDVEFDYSRFANVSGLEASDNATEFENISSTQTTPTTKLMGAFIDNNETQERENNFKTDDYGFGVHLLGYKIEGNTAFYHVFWARNQFSSVQRWFRVESDSLVEQAYTVNVRKRSDYMTDTVDLTLIVDGEELVNIGGFKIKGQMKLTAAVWNENEYMPLIDDIYNPFYSTAVVKNVKVPDDQDKLCRHGRAFYDGESAIKEIWIAASNDISEPGNISPFTLYKRFCYPCIKPCDHLCGAPCQYDKLSDGFNLVPLEIDGLEMEMADLTADCQNITNEIECNSTAYYINTKVVNFAGEETYACSNGIEIDLTPPHLGFVKCLDPKYDLDEPTGHISSSSTVGAYWNFTEDVGQVESYQVSIYNIATGAYQLISYDVGRKDKVTIELENGTFENGNDYNFQVTAINTAGLLANGSCSVHVSLFPPDVTKVLSKVLYTNNSGTIVNGRIPYFVDEPTRIGVEWEEGSPDVEFYGKNHSQDYSEKKTV